MKKIAPTNDLAPCILCGDDSALPLYPELGMVRCRHCGLVRADEVPERGRLERLYSESYFRSSDSGALGYDDYIADRDNISKTFERRMNEIENWLGRRGRLLDVGCATGFSLEVARRLGWEAQGVEISRFACDYARNDLGLEVFCGSLGEVDFAPETFDVITMWDYIEHSPDPVGELNRANSLLKAGGLLVLTTPNIASVPARIWGPRWMGIKQEEHLFYFTPPTIKRLLSQCRLEPVHLRHVGKYIDLDFFIKRAGLYSETIRRLLDRFARAIGVGETVFYVNPFDIMIVYGKKADDAE